MSSAIVFLWWAAMSASQAVAPPPPMPPRPVGSQLPPRENGERWASYTSPHAEPGYRYFYDDGTVREVGDEVFEFRFSVQGPDVTTIYKYRVACRQNDALSLRRLTVIRGDVVERDVNYEPGGQPFSRPAPNTVWADVANETCI
ncbi:hypothetical protein GCM10009422_08260 [Brevundimonas kwangchunensis]|uniref:Secreted protein n=1 Tax=Brevundimonas kwangchunensis TaxID=322163 RepID=A0ABN1GP55_9CAUL